MENPIIEIRSAEDAAKWIGRRVRMGWRWATGDGRRWLPGCGVVVRWVGSTLVTTHNCFSYTNNDPIVIELLDGAAHPRPEGEGWVWCQTAEEALGRFEGGSECEVSAASGTFVSVYSSNVHVDTYTYGQGVYLGRMQGPAVSLDQRGGAWIREATARVAPPVISITNVHIALSTDFSPCVEKTPERLAADAAQARYSEEADALIAAHRDLQAAVASADRADERAAENARFPLPDGWQWSDDRTVARDGEGGAVWVYGEYLEYAQGEDSAPLAVVRAVLARHDAENS